MILIPYRVNVLYPYQPWANVLLVVLNVAIWGLEWLGYIPESVIEYFVLDGFAPTRLIGCFFLHADFWHLAGNMLYLWIFGNAICANVGNLRYLGLYFAFGIFASITHLLFSDMPAVGASGAINGMIGFYFILYPYNPIECWWFFMLRMGTFEVAGIWLIGLWFLSDIIGAVLGWGIIAYWAHLGGFLIGVLCAFLMLKYKVLVLSEDDNETMVDYWNEKYSGKKMEKSERIRTSMPASNPYMHISPVIRAGAALPEKRESLKFLEFIKSRQEKVNTEKEPIPEKTGGEEMSGIGEKSYHCHANGMQTGPFTAAQIGEAIASGSLTVDDWVYAPEENDWVLMRDYFEFES